MISAVGLAVGLTALTVALLAGALVPPTRRLAGRVRPYTVAARTSLGRSADVRSVAAPDATHPGGVLRRLLGPLLESLARRFGRYLDATSEEGVLLKLDQAGMLTDIPEHRRVQEHRVRQVASAVVGAGGGIAAGLAFGLRPGLVLVLLLAGFLAGVTRPRSRIDRAIEERRARMRIELYTINQLIALNIRVGGGVAQAIRRVVDRGNGAVVDELTEILRAHESGVPIREALGRAARRSPEPHAARTYRLLAAGAEYGADLAEALLAHSEDVRDARREALRREATKRRAAMLVPIIGILAPVMLLFVAAPLPSIVFGVR